MARRTLLTLLSISVGTGLNIGTPFDGLCRRTAITSAAAFVLSIPLTAVHADEGAPIVLTEAEMAARVARKQELLKRQSAGASSFAGAGALEIRSDVNPDAAVNLRSRSVLDNAKVATSRKHSTSTQLTHSLTNP